MGKTLQTLFIRAQDSCPYANQALEKHLLELVEPGQLILYLWQNRQTVVIGKNQNPWQECRLAELEEDGGFLARRISGGGAVYHDLENLNFTFLSRPEQYQVQRNLELILLALESLGIRGEISGRNDLTVAGRKISGSAFYEGKSCFHHGTLMVGVDTELLSRYLRPSAKKLASKGVASVRSRVANLSEFCPGLNPDLLSEALLSAMKSYFGTGPELLSPATLDQQRLAALEQEFADPEWRLGRPIPCDLSLSERFPWGEVELRLSVNRGRVRGVQLFTDALRNELPAKVEEALLGAEFSGRELRARLDAIGEGDLASIIPVQL